MAPTDQVAKYTGQPPDFPRQCEAQSSYHKGRCKKRAIKGSNVCGTHGGQAPQVRQAAKIRLAVLVDPAIEVLAKLLKPGSGNVVKRELQFAAAKDVLDRNGFKSRDEVLITQEFEASKFSHLSDDELRTLVAIGQKISTARDVHDEA